MRPTLVVDCDPGIDDALALFYLSELHKAGDVDVALVTVAAGNVSLAQTWANAIHVLDLAGMAGVEVVPGSDRPLAGAAPEEDGAGFHGESGLGTMTVAPRAGESPHPDEAARRIVEVVNALDEAGEACWLLCLGPLTNVARALQLDPGIARPVDRCVVMGGALCRPHGNIREWAEYNVWWDPAAARTVFESGMPVRIVPLDATHLLTVEANDLSGFTGPVLQLLRDRITLHRQATKDPGALVHDAIAAIALTSPELFEWRPKRVTVHVDGPTPGRTQEVEAPEGAALEVAVPSDPAEIKSTLLAGLTPRLP